MTKPTITEPVEIRTADGKRVMMIECSRTWTSLARTSDPEIRHCGSCGHLVHITLSDAALVEHARQGHCVHMPVADGRPAMRTGGAFLPRSAEGADTAWLVIVDGPLAGTQIVLGDPVVTVGSGPADVVLDDPALAAEHLRFVREDDVLRLYAPGAEARTLVDGDVVELGASRAIYKTVRDP